MPLGALAGGVPGRARTPRFLALLALLALSLAATRASGDVTKDQCIDSNGHAQSLRRMGKFGAAREQLRICSDAACPRIVRDDCIRRLDDLDRVQPTIVFEAKDPSGRDLAAVRVTMDGEPLATTLNGAAIAVEPGEHTFAFRVTGQPTTTEAFVIHEGDKTRRESVVIGTPLPSQPPQPREGPASVATAARSETVPPAPAKSLGTRKVIGYTLAGLGVVGLGFGSFFGLDAISLNNKAGCDSQSHCASDSSRTSAQHAANASTVAFVAGGILATGGLVLVLVSPKSPAATSATLRLTPWVSDQGAGTTLAGVW